MTVDVHVREAYWFKAIIFSDSIRKKISILSSGQLSSMLLHPMDPNQTKKMNVLAKSSGWFAWNLPKNSMQLCQWWKMTYWFGLMYKYCLLHIAYERQVDGKLSMRHKAIPQLLCATTNPYAFFITLVPATYSHWFNLRRCVDLYLSYKAHALYNCNFNHFNTTSIQWIRFCSGLFVASESDIQTILLWLLLLLLQTK